ncbi:MAG: helix-turn-helix domain-containing protein [Acidimicrobiales bacterium]
MTVSFRNIDVDEAASIETWPAEAIEILIDRGSLSDWRRLASALASDPWGPLARTVEQAIELDCHYGVDRIMERILQQQRSTSTLAGRRRYADRLRELRQSAGLSMRQLAELTGTSAARISDYENARVSPTTDVLARLEDVLARFSSHGMP